MVEYFKINFHPAEFDVEKPNIAKCLNLGQFFRVLVSDLLTIFRIDKTSRLSLFAHCASCCVWLRRQTRLDENIAPATYRYCSNILSKHWSNKFWFGVLFRALTRANNQYALVHDLILFQIFKFKTHTARVLPFTRIFAQAMTNAQHDERWQDDANYTMCTLDLQHSVQKQIEKLKMVTRVLPVYYKTESLAHTTQFCSQRGHVSCDHVFKHKRSLLVRRQDYKLANQILFVSYFL